MDTETTTKSALAWFFTDPHYWGSVLVLLGLVALFAVSLAVQVRLARKPARWQMVAPALWLAGALATVVTSAVKGAAQMAWFSYRPPATDTFFRLLFTFLLLSVPAAVLALAGVLARILAAVREAGGHWRPPADQAETDETASP